MIVISSEAELSLAVSHLTAAEPRFAAVRESCGPPPLRRMKDGLEGLLRIVTDQMISLRAGLAIWERLTAEICPFTAESILSRQDEDLMRLGLSRAKARTFRALAAAVASGTLDFAALDQQEDSFIRSALVMLPGIGPWTAEIYLLAAMGRSDAWPAGDLALQAAAQHLFGLPDRPDQRRLTGLAEPWRPWRAVAARLLWSHYRMIKGLPQTIS
jgi:DNA-3-methyladenine glycosylase II